MAAYARQQVGSAVCSPATGTTTGSVTNDQAITFPACGTGGGTVTYWGLFDVLSGAGNLEVWGTATSTVISSTQTPPTVAVGGLIVNLD